MAEFDENTFVAGGYANRWIPSPHDPQYRGYEVNINTPINPPRFRDTALLLVPSQLPGIETGDAVLLVGTRVRGVSVLPGRCPALTVISEGELDRD